MYLYHRNVERLSKKEKKHYIRRNNILAYDGTGDDAIFLIVIRTCFFISSAVLKRHTPRAEMTTDQDLPMDGQSTTALFAAKGIDVTPNKDQGVIKVICCPTFKCVLWTNLKASCKTWHSIKMETCLHRLWSVQGTLETGQWLEIKWPSITPEGC